MIDIDARFLSIEIAGGFIGCTIGMYGLGNSKVSDQI